MQVILCVALALERRVYRIQERQGCTVLQEGHLGVGVDIRRAPPRRTHHLYFRCGPFVFALRGKVLGLVCTSDDVLRIWSPHVAPTRR